MTPRGETGAAAPEGIDFGLTAEDYGRFRQGFPDSFFERLHTLGIGVEGQRVLDIGTGTGQMARGMARRGARVTGLDRSRELLAVAARLDAEAGVEVAQVLASAEETGLPSGAFDAVTAAQCFTWFDPAAIGAEITRLLVPGGRFVLCQLDWLPRPGSIPAASEALILRHNPEWKYAGLDGLPVHHVGTLEDAGFTAIETLSYDVDLVYTHEAWRGRIRASAGISAAGLSAGAVARFDREHAAMLRSRFPTDPLAVPHRVFAISATRG